LVGCWNLEHSVSSEVTGFWVNTRRLARDRADEAGGVLQARAPPNSGGTLELERVTINGAASRNGVVEGMTIVTGEGKISWKYRWNWI